MSLEACLYWQGYTGQRPPQCNKGKPCTQCKSKFVKARAWEVRSGMWVSPYDQTAYTLDEAHQIELERYGQ